MKFEHWNPETDPHLKPGERALHQVLHAARAGKIEPWETILRTKARRWTSLQAAIERSGGMTGTLLEVGAGDAWASAAVLRHYPGVDAAWIVEIDDAALNELIPRTLEAFAVANRDITLVMGSFNAVPYVDHFDTVLALGALHHSANLYVTLRSLWLALKPGGRLYSQEPAMPDTTPNRFYVRRGEQIATFREGIEMRNDERSDTFFRRCEYLAALHHAGFDVDIEDLPPTHAAPPPPDVVPAARRWWEALLGKPAVLQAPPSVAPRDPLTPFNIFLVATKPLSATDAQPVTAWETA